MCRVDQIQLTSYSRNAEAVVWAVAAAPALNTTQESIQNALEQINQFQLPRDPLLQKLTTLMETREVWQGTATKLKSELDLSDAPNHLSRKLKEVQAPLQVQGIEIAFPPRQESGQTIRISKVNKTKLESTSQSAADLPVGPDDPTSMRDTPTVPGRNYRQIVSARTKPWRNDGRFDATGIVRPSCRQPLGPHHPQNCLRDAAPRNRNLRSEPFKPHHLPARYDADDESTNPQIEKGIKL
jgi:hypothetical protein